MLKLKSVNSECLAYHDTITCTLKIDYPLLVISIIDNFSRENKDGNLEGDTFFIQVTEL